LTNIDIRKTCVYELCKSLFIPYRSFQKYCSNECREHDTFIKYRYKRRKTIEKKCENCGKIFLSNDSKRKYCSSICQLYTKRKGHELTCPICKKSFTTTSYIKKYCNTLCYKEARRLRNQEYGNQIS